MASNKWYVLGQKVRLKKSGLFFVAAIILIVVYRAWFSTEARVASDFPIVSLAELKSQFDLPSAWSSKGAEGLGQYSVFTLWSWPVNFISGLMATLGFSFEAQERLLLVLPTLLLGYYGLNKLLSEFKLTKAAKLVGIIFYLTNTYVALLIDGGQLSIALTYSFFPLAYFLFLRGVGGRLIERLISGLGVIVLGFFDIRFVFLLALLLLVHFLYFRPKLIAWLKTSLIVGLLFAGFNAFWIIPTVLVNSPLLPQTYERVAQVDFLSFTTWKHALFMIAPHWYENVFGRIAPIPREFVAIPVLAFMAALVSRKKAVFFWVLVSILGIFLAKGASIPLPQIYPWLFSNVPGFSLFRDSTKFFFLIALSYSVLTAFTVDFLVKKLPRSYLLIPVLFVLYYLLLIRPVWLGQMTGTFSTPVYQNEYSTLATLLEKDSSFGRVLWIPARAPLGYVSPSHLSVEAARIQNLRPFATGIVGKYETFNFLREGPFMGELFDVAGISYIVYPFPDERREKLEEDNINYYHTFGKQLEGLEWLEGKIHDYPINIYKTKKSQDRFFIAQNTWLVIGSDKIYEEFGTGKSNELANNALIFAEDNLSSREFLKIPAVKVLQYETESGQPDSDQFLLPFDKYLFLSDFVDFSPSEKITWWKRENADFVWLRDFLEQKYGLSYQEFTYQKGVAISEGSGELIVKNYLVEKNKPLFARVLLSFRGGSVKFYQGERLVGELDTKLENPEEVTRKLTGYAETPDQYFKYDRSGFTALMVGRTDASGEDLKIVTEGAINIINFIATINDSKLVPETYKESTEIYTSGSFFNWENLTDNQKQTIFVSSDKPKISYEKKSPTQYRVKVEGLKKAATLVFSESFDSQWKLNGEKSFPVYSFLNGFAVPGDGEYEIIFEAQKYVEYGLIVSGFAVLFLLIFMFSHFKYNKYRKHD